ncbi:MAG: YkgJ family cysteine cluster protein [Gammaproteobacteria bacterium]|nr:YkgJ family cysteine cluster protein [Gammaproteobacteria bacterium]
MKQIPVDVEITSENKCSFCKGSNCCTYITQQIDTPRSMEDFDTLLWQVSHKDTEAYKDDDGWFLLLPTRCMHLEADGRCGIYEERPQVCREHTNDGCEFDGLAGADDFDLYFKDYDSLVTYCKKRYKKWDNRFKKWAKEKDK